MKITLSKSQWQNIGKQAGWIKEAQETPSQIPQPDINTPISDNKRMLDEAEMKPVIGEEIYNSLCLPNAQPIQEAVKYQDNDWYILYKNGQVEYMIDGRDGVIANPQDAKLFISRITDDPDTSYCDSCGEENPHFKIVDEGIGAYEFWGARGTDVDLQVATECCESGIVDKFGREKEMPSVDSVKSDYDDYDNYGD